MNGSFTVSVFSFSYKQSPPPYGDEHGGGFVFDCRCIPNPGREERFKARNGTDSDVIAFLEARPEVKTFFTSVSGLVDQAIEAYLARGFSNLMVSFGCTGGQHRSVYFAERLGRHVQERFGVNAPVKHLQLPKILADLKQAGKAGA